jgi:hypothetical protein
MSSHIRSIYSKLSSKSEKPKLIDWLLFIIICVVSFLFFCQGGDLGLTSKQSLTLLDSLIHGQFFHFYSYVSSLIPSGIYGGNSVYYNAFYSVILYGTFSIWNLPFWIFSKITGTAADGFALMMWSKTLVLLCTLYSGYLVYKIGLVLKMSVNKAKWMMFVYLTSPILMFGSVVFGQYDIFGVVITLLAILMFLKNKPYQFSMLMSLAICYKDFAAMIFIPLVLLTEKRMLHIIKYYAIGVSLFLLQNIIYHFDPGYVTVQKTGESLFGFYASLFSCGLPSGYGTASFIGITLMALCVIAYRKNIKDPFELAQYTIYIPLVMYGVFFAFIGWHPQWLVILVPYMVITAFMSKNFKLSMFIDIAISMGYVLISMIHYVNNVDQNMINSGILTKILHVSYDNSITFASIAAKFHVPMNLLATVFVGTILLEIVMKYPGFKNLYLSDPSEETVFLPERSVLWVRTLSILVYILPTLLLYFRFLLK